MFSHLKKISNELSPHNLDGYLCTDFKDLYYATGYPGRDAWLLILPDKVFYLTDSRYTLQIRQDLGRQVCVREIKQSLAQTCFDIVRQKKIKRLGFDERHFSLAAFKALKKVCPSGVRLVAANRLVERLRMIKDAQELAQIRNCLALQKIAIGYLKRIIRPGLSEVDVFGKLQDFVNHQGAKFSFIPIIASGPNSSFPHASVSSRKIGKTDLVLVDFGIELNGYKSDLTRIFVSDKIAHSIRDVYKAVAQAQEAAIAHIRPGVPVAEIDLIARKSLKKNKLEHFFSHSTGHGVGLDIHEPPRLSRKSTEILKAGMVVTVEPGVYIPGKFGIRIEDMVYVTPTGCDILSRGDKVEYPF